MNCWESHHRKPAVAQMLTSVGVRWYEGGHAAQTLNVQILDRPFRADADGSLRGTSANTIHRDGVALMEKRNRIKRHEIEAAILLGPTRAHVIAILLLGDLHSLGYSREAESNADVTGSDICAEAGFNP
jgi:hypothetical protein